MGQLVQEVEPQFKQMNFIVVHIEDEAEAALLEEYDIQTVPTTFLFDAKGNNVDTFYGAVAKEVLVERLTELNK